MITFNSRDKALELVEEGLVSADDMLIMALKYMSTDDVEDMLDCNELSERFIKVCKNLCKENEKILKDLENLEPKNES